MVFFEKKLMFSSEPLRLCGELNDLNRGDAEALRNPKLGKLKKPKGLTRNIMAFLAERFILPLCLCASAVKGFDRII